MSQLYIRLCSSVIVAHEGDSPMVVHNQAACMGSKHQMSLKALPRYVVWGMCYYAHIPSANGAHCSAIAATTT